MWSTCAAWLAATLLALLTAGWLYCRSVYDALERRGLKIIPPALFFGNQMDVVFRRKHIIDVLNDAYKYFPNEKYFGFFELLNPTIFIRDPELIRSITVKDFDHFVDHRSFIDESIEPLLARSLISLKGQKWRDMRATLSPAFTGSKMRHMTQFMVEAANQVVQHITSECNTNAKNTGSNKIDVEMRDYNTRYTNDVIANSAFGFTVNSVKDRENEFYVAGKQLTNFTSWQMFKSFIIMANPKLAKILNVTLLDKRLKTYFYGMLSENLKHREVNNIVRLDMVNLLLEAKKGVLKLETSESDNAGYATVEESEVGTKRVETKWTHEDLVAQAFLFFFAGFETSATLLSFVTHELALHADVQDKLRAEVDKATADGETITYEKLQQMKYLDMVISETLRLWTPAGFTDRICEKPFKLEPSSPGSKEILVKKGETVILAFAGLHLDSKYWDEPKKFDPERFSDENKHKIMPFTYLPFGSGPRNCIGSRFALMEAKIMVLYLVRHFMLTPSAKLKLPTRLQPTISSLRIEGGFWLTLEPRTLN